MPKQLAEVDGGPIAPFDVDSIWAVLQHGASFGPRRTALFAPHQPADHLSALVRPFSSSSAGKTASCGLGATRLTRSWLSPFSLYGSLLSWFMPTPTNVDCLKWSFAELERAAVRVAAALTAKGIKPGDKVLLIIPSSAEWVVMLWTCAFRCYTVATMDSKVLEEGNEVQLQEYIDQLSPSVVSFRSRATQPPSTD